MAKKVPKTKAGKKAKVGLVMGEYKRGALHSGSKKGPVVAKKKQAIAIALNQAGQSRKSKKKSSHSDKLSAVEKALS